MVDEKVTQAIQMVEIDPNLASDEDIRSPQEKKIPTEPTRVTSEAPRGISNGGSSTWVAENSNRSEIKENTSQNPSLPPIPRSGSPSKIIVESIHGVGTKHAPLPGVNSPNNPTPKPIKPAVSLGSMQDVMTLLSWDKTFPGGGESWSQIASEMIEVGSENRLEEALRPVFDPLRLSLPKRIEIKLQTPTGSTVTLYLSRVNGELRAQFSTPDASAFQWLQQQMNSLRQAHLSMPVAWLPPQREESKTTSESMRSTEPRRRREKRR
jgi:hypothetical protein